MQQHLLQFTSLIVFLALGIQAKMPPNKIDWGFEEKKEETSFLEKPEQKSSKMAQGQGHPVTQKKALRIGKKFGFNFSNQEGSPMDIQLDTLNGQWVLSKSKTMHSQKTETGTDGISHQCAKTNGCTVIEIKTLYIDVNHSKKTLLENEKLVYPNYE